METRVHVTAEDGHRFEGYAWRRATELQLTAAMDYYGGGVAKQAGDMSHCPVVLPFGAKDAHVRSTRWRSHAKRFF